jgi:transcriptional regulator with XRE-family HTH domain
MNGLEIKERRKNLGLTQKQLAELIGVSTQTINGYENGKEIPVTKHQILDTVLQSVHSNISNNKKSNIINSVVASNSNLSGYDKKIRELNERIFEHYEIIKLLSPKTEEAKHHEEIIRLLKIQIGIIETAKENHNN